MIATSMRTRRTGSTSRPASINGYLAKVSEEQRVALERLRKTIRAAAPQAEECISYGIAAFRHHGMLVGFGATKTHCALYLMSASTLDAFREDVDGLDVSKGTIRFQPAKPLAAALVRKLVKARIAENETPR